MNITVIIILTVIIAAQSVMMYGADRRAVASTNAIANQPPATVTNPFPESHTYLPSSIRWKENVAELEGTLEKIHTIRGVTFDWKEAYGGHSDIGVIAEEIGWVFPEIVGFESDGSGYAYGVDYVKLGPILLEAIKDLDNLVDAQAAEIDSLETRIATLENTVYKK